MPTTAFPSAPSNDSARDFQSPRSCSFLGCLILFVFLVFQWCRISFAAPKCTFHRQNKLELTPCSYTCQTRIPLCGKDCFSAQQCQEGWLSVFGKGRAGIVGYLGKMNIHLIAVGQRTPLWIREGFAEYAKRLTGECRLRLVEIPAGKRISGDLRKVIRTEGGKMLKAVPTGAHVVALDVNGSHWSTESLAGILSKWMSMGKDIALLVGGPDGLAPDCAKAAHQSWSLSSLTFPHLLVRVIVAEQLYRALSLLRNHPYHRE